MGFYANGQKTGGTRVVGRSEFLRLTVPYTL